MKFNFLMALLATTVISNTASAATSAMTEELDPSASNINEVLMENEILNADSRIIVNESKVTNAVEDCYRDTCAVYIEVDKARQRATIRINGEILMDKSGSLKDGEVRATTGMAGHNTPNFDRHPATPLRAYSKYSSSKYPGGNWISTIDGKGYGNMPFVVFISGGFGVHGTTGTDKTGNISKLGTVPLSHGCIRIHPLNAKVFNAAVTKHGAANTWIYVHN